MTIRKSASAKKRLAELSRKNRETAALRSSDVVIEYATDEAATVAGIQRGLDDIHAGRVSSNAEVRADIDTITAEAKAIREVTPSPEPKI